MSNFTKNVIYYIKRLYSFLIDLLIIILIIISALFYLYIKCIDIEVENEFAQDKPGEKDVPTSTSLIYTKDEDDKPYDPFKGDKLRNPNDLYFHSDIDEEKVFHNHQDNLEAFYKNRMASIYGPRVKVGFLELTEDFINKLNNYKETGKLDENNDRPIQSQEQYDRLIESLRSGDIVIYSPKKADESMSSDKPESDFSISPVTPVEISYVRRRYMVVSELGRNWEHTRNDPINLEMLKKFDVNYYRAFKHYNCADDTDYVESIHKDRFEKVKSKYHESSNTEWMEKESYNLDNLFEDKK